MSIGKRRLLWILLGTVGISVLVLCAICWANWERRAAQAAQMEDAGPSVDTATVWVVGDIISHWAVQKSAERYGYSTFFKYVEKDLAGADVAIGNMEFPLAGPPYTGYPFFSGSDQFARYLRDVGFDVLLTANNHMLDKGSEGLQRTISALERMNISYTGIAADAKADTLKNPLFVPVKGVTLALVNFTYGTNCAADSRWPKVLRLNRKALTPVLRRAREGADFVLVFPHWGEEYRLRHNDRQEEMARWLVEQGADAIIGGHPHVVQDYQEIDGVPVIYSLGNALSNQNDLPARLEAAATFKIVIPDGEKPQLLKPSFTYLWCTKPGMVEDSYAVVPVTLPADCWRVPKDYENMLKTYTSLKEGGYLP